MPTHTGPSLSALDRDECVGLLGTSPIGRVGVCVGALPVVLPVNFGLIDGAVVLRTVPGTKLHAATAGAVVAFEVDGYADDGSHGWSVLVQGIASEITDPAEQARAEAAGIPSWALDGRADRYVRIDMAVVTGRRFAR